MGLYYDSQQTPKARLVIKGFEEPTKDKISKDFPTCSKENLRVALSIVAQKKWKLNSIGIKLHFYKEKTLIENYMCNLLKKPVQIKYGF